MFAGALIRRAIPSAGYSLLTGYSSHALRAEFLALKRRLPSLWTNSYFVSTVGGATLETLKRYVESQKGK